MQTDVKRHLFWRSIAVFTDAGVPETLVAGGVMAYVVGFVGNPIRPRRWLGVGVWLGGWVVGILANWLYAYLTRPILV